MNLIQIKCTKRKHSTMAVNNTIIVFWDRTPEFGTNIPIFSTNFTLWMYGMWHPDILLVRTNVSVLYTSYTLRVEMKMEEVQDHNVHAYHNMNFILYMDNVVNTSLTVDSNNEQNVTIQNATVFTKLCISFYKTVHNISVTVYSYTRYL